jgi:hypothetical protein
MRFVVQEILMILGFWSGGFLLSSRILPCMTPANPPVGPSGDIPCPKVSLKCYIASGISLLYGLGWQYVVGWKTQFSSVDLIITVAVGATLGAALARILCPKPL